MKAFLFADIPSGKLDRSYCDQFDICCAQNKRGGGFKLMSFMTKKLQNLRVRQRSDIISNCG